MIKFKICVFKPKLGGDLAGLRETPVRTSCQPTYPYTDKTFRIWIYVDKTIWECALYVGWHEVLAEKRAPERQMIPTY